MKWSWKVSTEAVVSFVFTISISAVAFWMETRSPLVQSVDTSALASFFRLASFVFLFPGWWLALWIFGYWSAPTLGSNIFIVVVNGLLYAIPLFCIIRIVRSRRDIHVEIN